MIFISFLSLHNFFKLSQKLVQRAFPASPQEVRSARYDVIGELMESDPLWDTDLLDPKGVMNII